MRPVMKPSFIMAGVLCIVWCGCGASAGGADPTASGTPRTEQAVCGTAAEGSNVFCFQRAAGRKDEVSLHFAASSVPGRMAELFVEYGEGLAYESTEAGAAATEAGKEVIVQPAGDGRLRVVVYSANNTNDLLSGEIATLRFERLGNAATRVELRDTTIAPAGANLRLKLGEAIDL
jgi:hypothetical protein